MKISVFILSLFVFTVLCFNCVFAEGFDGNQWKLLNRYRDARIMRKVLLQGIYAGASVMNITRAKEVYPSTNFESLVEKLDNFYYNDDRNLSIPVNQALYLISMQLTNKPKSDTDAALKKFREGFREEFLKKEAK